ncbi:helix-turn-helix domain-containing protein [Priestia megaterium]|uniref:helix-turn-helix domain-containing protein n=1 Tax=Priestia megaterium TaxID=1404 RepID=UPI003CC56D8A
MGEGNRPKIITRITVKLESPETIKANIEEWRNEVRTKALISLKAWIQSIAGYEITTRELAEETGISEKQARDYFNGYSLPTEMNFNKIARRYNSTVEDFFKFADLQISRETFFDKFFQWKELRHARNKFE